MVQFEPHLPFGLVRTLRNLGGLGRLPLEVIEKIARMFWIPLNRLWQQNRHFARRIEHAFQQQSNYSWGLPVLSIRGPGYPPRWSVSSTPPDWSTLSFSGIP